MRLLAVTVVFSCAAPTGGALDERCQDGCRPPPHLEWVEDGAPISLPFSPRLMAPFWNGLVMTAFDERGIALVSYEGEVEMLGRGSPSAGFTLGSHDILWMEQGPTGPRLYRRTSTGIVDDIAFPIPNARDARFVIQNDWSSMHHGLVVRDATTLYWVRFEHSDPTSPSSIELGAAPEGGYVAALFQPEREEGSRLVVVFRDPDEIVLADHRGAIRRMAFPHRIRDAALRWRDLAVLTDDDALYAVYPISNARRFLASLAGVRQIWGRDQDLVACDPSGEVVMVSEYGDVARERVGPVGDACTIAERYQYTYEYYSFGATTLDGYPLLHYPSSDGIPLFTTAE